jgi:hypothetical protein
LLNNQERQHRKDCGGNLPPNEAAPLQPMSSVISRSLEDMSCLRAAGTVNLAMIMIYFFL